MSDDGEPDTQGLRRYERRTVIAHQPPSPTIQGVLIEAYDDCFVLAHAKSLDDGEELGGEIIILRNPGVFLQTVIQRGAQ